MRALIVGCVAVAFCASCGGSSSQPGSNPDAGSGASGGTQINLTITTSGNGLVRGAGSDCRGSCTVPYAAGTQGHLAPGPDSGAPFVAWAGARGGPRRGALAPGPPPA